MAEFPTLPLFTDAYLADTRHLTAAQHGAYLLLLMMAWRMPDCLLPDDDAKLSAWAAMDFRTWRKNKETVMGFWKKTPEGKFYQGRLLDERKRVEQLRSKRVDAGKASALKRHETVSTHVQQNDIKNPTIPEPEPKPVSNADDAREGPQSDIFKIGEMISQITGWADDPNWTGSYARLKVWIETDHDPYLDIIPAIKATMQKRKGRGPPKTLNYFDGPVADAKATRLQPMPKGKTNVPRSHNQSPVDALFAGFAASVGADPVP